MKRSVAPWRFLLFITILFIASTVFFAFDHALTRPVRFHAAVTAAALAEVETLLNKMAFPNNVSEGTVIRAATVSSTSFGVFIKQIAPSWGRTLVTKRANISMGFFFLTMVLLMFFRFYQSARANSDSEPAPPKFYRFS